jgi:hypothetical protein
MANALDAPLPLRYSPHPVGDALQGAAGDCNSPGATRAWFDSRVAHHFFPYQVLALRGVTFRRTSETHGMQLASYLSTSRHGIFYPRGRIPAMLHLLRRRLKQATARYPMIRQRAAGLLAARWR